MMSNNYDDPEREDLLRRPAPCRPYQVNTAKLLIPRSALEQTLSILQSAKRIETCCFWYGRETEEGSALVAAVVVPKQRGTWGNYDVAPAAMLAVSHATRAEGLVNLAQVHSHPSANVEHSLYDDRRAASRGILSIVFPSYGNWRGPWPRGVGVHEFQIDYWHLLSEDVAAHRAIIDVGAVKLIDLR